MTSLKENISQEPPCRKERLHLKKLDRRIKSLILCIAELLIGLILLIKPVGFTSILIVCSGIGLIIKGLLDILRYFRTTAKEASLQEGLSQGLIYLLIGAFCTFQSQWLMQAVSFSGIIYAVLIMLLGVEKIQNTVDAHRLGCKNWFYPAIAAVISIASVIIIFINPFSVERNLLVFSGAILLVEMVIDIIGLYMNLKENAA